MGCKTPGVATLLGIDIGGTGIKGAPVDTRTGTMFGERMRIPTPQPATPAAVADVIATIAHDFAWTGPVGATFPAVIRRGVVETATNVDRSWIGTDAAALFSKATGSQATVINDADAAGIAEMEFGAGAHRTGTVLMVTLGTGIGTAVFHGGVLVPNMQFGHLEVRGKSAELRASETVRERKGLSWKRWAKRLNEYFEQLESLVWPELIIIGGGVSKKADKFVPLLKTRAELVAATLRNDAGIIGAAIAARRAT